MTIYSFVAWPVSAWRGKKSFGSTFTARLSRLIACSTGTDFARAKMEIVGALNLHICVSHLSFSGQETSEVGDTEFVVVKPPLTTTRTATSLLRMLIRPARPDRDGDEGEREHNRSRPGILPRF